MQKLKIMLVKLLSVLMLFSSISFPSYATSIGANGGWEQVDGQWKYKDGGTGGYITDRWIESTSEVGLWYYVDQNGVMAVSTTTPDGYYVNERGEWRASSSGGSSNSSQVAPPSQSQPKNSGKNIWDEADAAGCNDIGDHPLPITDKEKENMANATYY